MIEVAGGDTAKRRQERIVDGLILVYEITVDFVTASFFGLRCDKGEEELRQRGERVSLVSPHSEGRSVLWTSGGLLVRGQPPTAPA